MKLKIIYITPFQDSLLINIFPWKKISKIHEHPIAQTPTPTILITDLTTIHLTLINLRISNIETNMRTRQISLPPSLTLLVVQAWKRATCMTETVPKEKYGLPSFSSPPSPPHFLFSPQTSPQRNLLRNNAYTSRD